MTAGRGAWWVGLAGIFLLVAGSGWYQAVSAPVFSVTDEQAHVGYLLALADGRLPTIDSPIDADAGGPDLVARLEWQPHRRRDIWVANNPPLPYLLALGPGLLTRAEDVPGGPLVGLRVTNAVFLAAAAVVVARLGRHLAGGDPRVGLIAGGIFAASPHVGFVAGSGAVDGVAVLCSVALLDALVAVCRRGPTRRDLVRLAVWCALGAAARPMTAALAGAAGVVAVAIAAWRRRQPDPAAAEPPAPAARHARPAAALDDESVFVYDQDRDPALAEDALFVEAPRWADQADGPDGSADAGADGSDGKGAVGAGDPVAAARRVGPIGAALIVGLPTLALDGWWYLRNLSLYGDATGSERLLQKFLRRSPGTLLDGLGHKSIWREAMRTLFLRRIEVALPHDALAWTPVVIGLAIVAALGTAVVVALDQRRAAVAGEEPATSTVAWVAMVLIAAVEVLLIAQHWAGGGAPHPRYFLPILAVLTSAFGLVAVRTVGSWIGALVIGALAALQVAQAPRALRFALRNVTDPLPDDLNRSIGPAWLPGAGGWAAALGTLALLVALALVARPDEDEPADEHGPADEHEPAEARADGLRPEAAPAAAGGTGLPARPPGSDPGSRR